MAKFLYKAKNKRGEVVTGTVKAITEEEAEKVLLKHNLTPSRIVPEEQKRYFPFLMARVSGKEKAVFSRQLSTMLSAGLPLTKALSILSGNIENDYFKNIIQEIYTDLEEGYSFSVALSKHPQVFDKVYVSVIGSGETTGRLDLVLSQMATQLENDNNFISYIKGALYYPIFILIALVFIGGYMLTTVVPKLKSMFDQMGRELPLTTRAMLSISSFMQHWWFLILLIVLFIIIFLKLWFQTDAGSRFINKLELKTPGLNKLFVSLYMSRFARVMELLVGAGVPILDSLKIGSTVINNSIYEDSLTNVAKQIEKGVPLSAQLAKENVFPPLVAQMVSVGEETGELDKVLGKVAEYYEESANQNIKVISTLIEPIILVIIGLAVAFMVFSIILPIYNIAQFGG